MRPNEGSGKSGSLFNAQSELPAHLARIEEAAPEYVSQKPQSGTAKPIFDSPIRLGEKACHVWNEAHFAGAAPVVEVGAQVKYLKRRACRARRYWINGRVGG